MLVLSRKRGEGIVVGDEVTLTVLEVRGDRVKLGLDGPAEVPIHREEIHRKIQSSQSALELVNNRFSVLILNGFR